MSDYLEYVLSAMRRAAAIDCPWTLTPTQAGDIVAEVERLRGERAAVVSFLRETLATSETTYASDDLDYAIAVIERGEHRREEKP